MRICKPNEAGFIFGQGSPSMSGMFGPTFAASASAPPQPLAQAASTSSVGFLDPSITPSTPNTNTTVSITNDPSTGWISTTVTMPSSTTATTNPTVASSMPSTINPTSNAQPSTPDAFNNGLAKGDAVVGLNGLSTGLSTFGGPIGKGVGSALGVAADLLGLDVQSLTLADFASPAAPAAIGAFGYPGYTQVGSLGFTAPGPLGNDVMGMCGPNHGLDSAGISTGGESTSGSGTNSNGGTNDGMGPGGVGGW